MRICAKCILTENTPNITFDENGVCNYCHTHQKVEYLPIEEFEKVLEKHRNKGKKYDCMVALSGGRDSTFVLYKLVTKYNMRVLAVNYQNPFADPTAARNIKNATGKLGVDLVSVPSKNDIHRRTFRSNLKTWCRRPSLAVVPMMCIACKLMWWEMLKIARKNRIRLIVSGNNRFEDTAYKKALLGVSMEEKWETTFAKSLAGVLKEVIKNIGYLKPAFLPTIFKAYFFGDSYAIGAKILDRNIDKLDFFYYYRWDEEEIMSTIQRELDWDYPRITNSTWRWDCQVAHLKDLIYLHTIKITERDDLYAKMVREGVLTRDEALERIETENRLPLDIVKDVLTEADITYEEFVKVLEDSLAQNNS